MRKQRHTAQRGALSAARRAALLAAGLALDPFGREWDAKFGTLLLYKQAPPACPPPPGTRGG